MPDSEKVKQAITDGASEGFGGSLINLILGGIMLWVGQTTFQHNGELAGMESQFDAIEERYKSLRNRHDDLVGSLNDRTRSRFTEEDGDKLGQRIEGLRYDQSLLTDEVREKVGALKMELAAMRIEAETRQKVEPTGNRGGSPAIMTDLSVIRHVSLLQAELNDLRSELRRMHRERNSEPAYYGNRSQMGHSDSFSSPIEDATYAKRPHTNSSATAKARLPHHAARIW